MSRTCVCAASLGAAGGLGFAIEHLDGWRVGCGGAWRRVAARRRSGGGAEAERRRSGGGAEAERRRSGGGAEATAAVFFAKSSSGLRLPAETLRKRQPPPPSDHAAGCAKSRRPGARRGPPPRFRAGCGAASMCASVYGHKADRAVESKPIASRWIPVFTGMTVRERLGCREVARCRGIADTIGSHHGDASRPEKRTPGKLPRDRQPSGGSASARMGACRNLDSRASALPPVGR